MSLVLVEEWISSTRKIEPALDKSGEYFSWGRAPDYDESSSSGKTIILGNGNKFMSVKL
jgi:hypothetical protein